MEPKSKENQSTNRCEKTMKKGGPKIEKSGLGSPKGRFWEPFWTIFHQKSMKKSMPKSMPKK